MRKKKIKLLKIILGLLISLLLLVIGAFLVFNSYYGKMNYKKLHSSSINSQEKEKIDKEMKDNNGVNSPEERIKAAEEAILKNLKNQSTKLVSADHVFNILLIGSDHRGEVEGSRSDSMILLSLNEQTKEITMTSFMRDSYVEIPEYGNNRLNAAYSYGGESLLIDTIEQNFKVDIDRYAQVDFFAFIDIIDAIGGIDINIEENEVDLINGYSSEINNIQGDTSYVPLTQSGLVNLTGKQALSYSRIRYVGDGDFQRTERQRNVLNAAFNKVKNLNIIKLNTLFNKILPSITTDLSRGESLSLLINISEYKDYQINSNRVPYDNTWEDMRVDGMAVLSVDFESNIKKLQEDIYNLTE